MRKKSPLLRFESKPQPLILRKICETEIVKADISIDICIKTMRILPRIVSDNGCPKLGGCCPMSDGGSPKAGERSPRSDYHRPKAGKRSPPSGVLSPKAVNHRPKAGSGSPTSGGNAPKAFLYQSDSR